VTAGSRAAAGEREDAGPAQAAELPRGGRRLFPDRRIVAYYGAPQDDELGALGIGTPATRRGGSSARPKPYATPGAPVLPAMELIAVTAAAHPGEGGATTRARTQGHQPLPARRAQGQGAADPRHPAGRSDFFTEARGCERWLKEPDVGLALDPSGGWARPGARAGDRHVEAREVNATSAWLSQIVERATCRRSCSSSTSSPNDMVDDTQLQERPGLAMVLNADGFGGQAIKKAKYRAFTRSPARLLLRGLQALLPRGLDLMTPRQVLRLQPPPDVVIYE
jgi:hypothetical protein